MRYNGSDWVAVGSAGFSAGQAYYTSLAIAPDGTPYVAYMDMANSNKATVMRYDGSAWMAVVGAGFSAGEIGSTSLAIAPDGTPSVAYADYGNSGKATVMELNNRHHHDAQLGCQSLGHRGVGHLHRHGVAGRSHRHGHLHGWRDHPGSASLSGGAATCGTASLHGRRPQHHRRLFGRQHLRRFHVGTLHPNGL